MASSIKIARMGLLVSTLVTASAIYFFRPYFKWPYPPPTTLILESQGLLDIFGTMFGCRRAAADIAWLNVLQYYGGYGDPASEDDPIGHVHAGGHYPRLKLFCQRVGRLDPYFHQAYIYGAASLGWNIKRYDDAIDLLMEGINADPKYWYYQTFISAIGYTQKTDVRKLTAVLEEAIKNPDCPDLVRNILGNIYIKRRDWRNAVRIFTGLLENSRDPGYRQRAQDQLHKILHTAAINHQH